MDLNYTYFLWIKIYTCVVNFIEPFSHTCVTPCIRGIQKTFMLVVSKFLFSTRRELFLITCTYVYIQKKKLSMDDCWSTSVLRFITQSPYIIKDWTIFNRKWKLWMINRNINLPYFDKTINENNHEEYK